MALKTFPLFDAPEGDIEDNIPIAYAPELKTLDGMNIPDELMLQYQRAETLHSLIIHDPEVPPNQKAQVIATITAILAQITKIQTDLYNSERMKRLEQVLLSVIKHLPAESQTAFLEAYEHELG